MNISKMNSATISVSEIIKSTDYNIRDYNRTPLKQLFEKRIRCIILRSRAVKRIRDICRIRDGPNMGQFKCLNCNNLTDKLHNAHVGKRLVRIIETSKDELKCKWWSNILDESKKYHIAVVCQTCNNSLDDDHEWSQKLCTFNIGQQVEILWSIEPNHGSVDYGGFPYTDKDGKEYRIPLADFDTEINLENKYPVKWHKGFVSKINKKFGVLVSYTKEKEVGWLRPSDLNINIGIRHISLTTPYSNEGVMDHAHLETIPDVDNSSSSDPSDNDSDNNCSDNDCSDNYHDCHSDPVLVKDYVRVCRDLDGNSWWYGRVTKTEYDTNSVDKLVITLKASNGGSWVETYLGDSDPRIVVISESEFRSRIRFTGSFGGCKTLQPITKIPKLPY